jgi:hypothetical protein
MANYPTSDPSFSAKSAGNTIQAAHVNALQDEVVAIGSALRSGLSHALIVSTGGLTVSTGSVNVGGPSSVATLQVNGTSTFVGNVLVTGTLTVGGNQFGGVPDAARVIANSTQSFGSGAFTPITVLRTQIILTNSSMHSTASNPGRITPQSTGLYQVRGQIRFNQNSSGARVVQVVDSSGGVIGDARAAAVVTTDTVLQASGLKRFDALGGYVELQAYQDSGSTMSVLATETWLEMVKL